MTDTVTYEARKDAGGWSNIVKLRVTESGLTIIEDEMDVSDGNAQQARLFAAALNFAEGYDGDAVKAIEALGETK